MAVFLPTTHRQQQPPAAPPPTTSSYSSRRSADESLSSSRAPMHRLQHSHSFTSWSAYEDHSRSSRLTTTKKSLTDYCFFSIICCGAWLSCFRLMTHDSGSSCKRECQLSVDLEYFQQQYTLDPLNTCSKLFMVIVLYQYFEVVQKWPSHTDIWIFWSTITFEQPEMVRTKQ